MAHTDHRRVAGARRARRNVLGRTRPTADGGRTGQQVGDLEAAERFFATPQTEQDVYPHPELLPQLQPSTVRFLGGDPTLGRAWVGKDTEGEICLLVDQGGAGAASCNRLSDFVSQGITLGFNQFSASWNGRDWASTSPDGYRQGQTDP